MIRNKKPPPLEDAAVIAQCLHELHIHYCSKCGLKQPSLGPQTIRVLEALAKGLEISDIATMAIYHRSTVKYHIQRAKDALFISGRSNTYLVVQAHRMRLINLDRDTVT